MARAFTPGLIASPRCRVVRRRELPVPGTVLVAVGDSVSATQSVLSAELPGELHILRIPEKMGIEAIEVQRGLQIAEGDAVSEGEILCEHRGLFGLFKSTFAAPCDGTIEFVAERTGHVGLRLASTPIDVEAYIDGTVIECEVEKAVRIESHAGLVQGIFGVGGERVGSLEVLPLAPDEELLEQHLSADLTGKVLVGGKNCTAQVLDRAAQAGAVGLIIGSLDDRALASYVGYDMGIALTGDEPVSMTVILTEGFGAIPFSVRTFELLSQFNGARASINGTTQVRAGAVRPEVILSRDGLHDGVSEIEETGLHLRLGAKVRIIRVPYFGAFAEVVELPHEAEKIETGAVTRVLRAKLENGEMVTVPRANVELV